MHSIRSYTGSHKRLIFNYHWLGPCLCTMNDGQMKRGKYNLS